ncbi:MAG: helix-turn-helix domain-containing protein [Lachnospiraceae bacterium]|nr:helix-turn-helix domain-containing protein [Lachnospiraceae bacterium]
MEDTTYGSITAPVFEQNEKRTYTVEEIQNILGISQPTAYSLVRRKIFHYVKIGRNIRISKKSFDKWLDQGMPEGGAEHE